MAARKRSSEELTKAAIVEEAHQQFIEKGYEHVSMRSIASALRCSHGALYYHFQNKAALFYTVIEHYFEQLNQIIDAIATSGATGEEKLRQLFLQFLQFALNHPQQYELMFLKRDNGIDVLAQQAANRSYEKFAQAAQQFSDQRLSIQPIYCAFLALHGFNTYYIGKVNDFQEVELLAQGHVSFVLHSLTGKF